MKRHVIAVIGGAVAGSEAAALCAARGATAVVFEQGDRPYGKIEDGLPRWHEKLREKEYTKIEENLTRDDVMFVPCTCVGEDVTIQQMQELEFSAILLANGAWRDRPLPIEGVDRYIGEGLLYQNAFVHWFNHQHEADYDGPRYEVPEGAAVVGGGLASIDVVKILSLTTIARALRGREIEVDLIELEQKGVPKWCAARGIDPDSLDVPPPTLYYRRNMEDMPLASFPADATDAQKDKVRNARTKIMKRVMERYRVAFEPLHAPASALTEGKRLVGLRFQRTQIVDGRVRPIEGNFIDVRAPLFISSIGSVPHPIDGIPMKGELYDYTDWDTGEVRGLPGVFGLGNVLTGKGNIKDSRINAQEIARSVLEGFLSVQDIDKAVDAAQDALRSAAEPVIAAALARPETEDGPIRAFVQKRWKTLGYDGFEAWMASKR